VPKAPGPTNQNAALDSTPPDPGQLTLNYIFKCIPMRLYPLLCGMRTCWRPTGTCWPQKPEGLKMRLILVACGRGWGAVTPATTTFFCMVVCMVAGAWNGKRGRGRES
jgi:hypothetical protein